MWHKSRNDRFGFLLPVSFTREETTQSLQILRYKHDFLNFFFTMPFILLVFVNLYSLQISDITLADMLRHTNIFG